MERSTENNSPPKNLARDGALRFMIEALRSRIAQETPTRVYVIIARNLDIPAHLWRGSVSGITADGKNRAADFDNLGSGEGVVPAPLAQKFCMTTGRIAAHIVHVAAKMALLYQGAVEAHNCDVYVLQVANSSDFESVCDRMYKAGIPFVRYHDTDRLWHGEQLTALCTFPLAESRCGAFADMKSYRCACNDAHSATQYPTSNEVNFTVKNSNA